MEGDVSVEPVEEWDPITAPIKIGRIE